MGIRIATGRGLLRTASDGILLQLPGGTESFLPETLDWIARVDAAGGTYRSDSKRIADALIRAITGQPFNERIIWLMAFLGDNLAAGLVPLIDRKHFGTPANIGFTDGNFAQSRGLTSDGMVKILDAGFKPSDLGPNNNGGIGCWPTRIAHTGTTSSPMGMANNPGGGTRAFDIYLGTAEYGGEWNQALPGHSAVVSTAPSEGHYYLQRGLPTLRTLDVNGVQKAYSSDNDAAAGAGATNIRLMGDDPTNVTPGPRYWAGRSGLFYATDGAISPADRPKLHGILRNKLMVPTGRVQA